MYYDCPTLKEPPGFVPLDPTFLPAPSAPEGRGGCVAASAQLARLGQRRAGVRDRGDGKPPVLESCPETRGPKGATATSPEGRQQAGRTGAWGLELPSNARHPKLHSSTWGKTFPLKPAGFPLLRRAQLFVFRVVFLVSRYSGCARP